MSHNKKQQRVAHIYNPENQTREELIDNFVIRTKLYQKIFRSISTTTLEEPPQHFLIEGQRGTGKTSLMLRIRYELQGNDEISHILAVQLPEEQYGIFDLCRLWENVADYLHDEPGFDGLLDKLDAIAGQKDYPIYCFKVLDEFLVANGKRLVLFIDNFGDMLSRFTDIEQKRLRDIFHTTKYIQLIAASAQTLEHTYKYTQPFFEFFKIIRLKNLNKEEAVLLLHQLAKRYDAEEKINTIANQTPERIETIRLLTGGVPRTIVLLFEIFLDKSGDVFEDLEALLDRVTPLYKHRMDGLKTQQQAIIDVIALNWDGISTADIVKGLKGRGFDNKKVSAQLNALTRNDLVSARFIDKKNKIYFIRERFFNIWYLMRLGRRKSGDRVLWLVNFLKEWYAPRELAERARFHIECAKRGELNPKGAYLMGEALSRIIPDMELQDELICETREFLSTHDNHLADRLPLSKKAQLEKKAKKGDTDAMFYHGVFYDTIIKDSDKAIVYYKMAVNKGDAKGMNNLAMLYFKDNKVEKSDLAKKLINKAISIKNDQRFLDTLANILLWQNNFDTSDTIIRDILTKHNYQKIIRAVTDYFIFLLAKKQLHAAYRLFVDFPSLQDELKPVYYALMTLLKDEYPKEYLKMGEELETTVVEILNKVEEMRKKYSA